MCLALDVGLACLALGIERVEFQVEIMLADRRLATLPAIGMPDPQADTAAKLVTRAGSGAIQIASGDIVMVRILGIVLLPQMGGLVMMFAMAVGARPT